MTHTVTGYDSKGQQTGTAPLVTSTYTNACDIARNKIASGSYAYVTVTNEYGEEMGRWN